MNGRPKFTAEELLSYGLNEQDVTELTERDWLDMDWLRAGHKNPRGWVNPKKDMNYTKLVVKEAVLRLLRRGCSNREIHRKLGLHTLTVRRLRSEFDQIFRCKCGQSGDHRGFCSHRFRRSIKRMQVMQHFTLHSPRHYIGLLIPLSRWTTFRDPRMALRSIEKFMRLNQGNTIDDWENLFLSKREAIIDAKIAALVSETAAKERAHLIRPSVTEFFRKLATPSAIQYAKDNPEK